MLTNDKGAAQVHPSAGERKGAATSGIHQAYHRMCFQWANLEPLLKGSRLWRHPTGEQ